jgi:translation initiation factor IF-3
MGHPDGAPKLTGRNIYVMLTPLPVNKRKLKYHVKEGPSQPAAAATAPASPPPA